MAMAFLDLLWTKTAMYAIVYILKCVLVWCFFARYRPVEQFPMMQCLAGYTCRLGQHLQPRDQIGLICVFLECVADPTD